MVLCLPIEVLCLILANVCNGDLKSLVSLSTVCKLFRQVPLQSELWAHLRRNRVWPDHNVVLRLLSSASKMAPVAKEHLRCICIDTRSGETPWHCNIPESLDLLCLEASTEQRRQYRMCCHPPTDIRYCEQAGNIPSNPCLGCCCPNLEELKFESLDPHQSLPSSLRKIHATDLWNQDDFDWNQIVRCKELKGFTGDGYLPSPMEFVRIITKLPSFKLLMWHSDRANLLCEFAFAVLPISGLRIVPTLSCRQECEDVMRKSPGLKLAPCGAFMRTPIV